MRIFNLLMSLIIVVLLAVSGCGEYRDSEESFDDEAQECYLDGGEMMSVRDVLFIERDISYIRVSWIEDIRGIKRMAFLQIGDRVVDPTNPDDYSDFWITEQRGQRLNPDDLVCSTAFLHIGLMRMTDYSSSGPLDEGEDSEKLGWWVSCRVRDCSPQE